MNSPSNFQCGYIAIVGLPNVGKSTLLNRFLNCKLSAVSSKPQTTYDNVLGILNESSRQMIFVDTPGWLHPHDSFRSCMKKAILRTISEDADIILWLIDPQNYSKEDLKFAEVLKKAQIPVVLGINKVDLAYDKENMARMFGQLKEGLGEGTKVHLLSAKTGMGVANLKKELEAMLPAAPAFFPTDQITDRWERFYVAQIIRENIFHMFSEEIPHASFVSIDEFRERPGQKDFVKAIIYVETAGQKRIVVGKGGTAIKSLGEKSRGEMEAQLGRAFYLELTVKVHKNWREDNVFLRNRLRPEMTETSS